MSNQNDDVLSQEDIDTLLASAGVDDISDSAPAAETKSEQLAPSDSSTVDGVLIKKEEKVLNDIFLKSFQWAGNVLDTLMHNVDVEITGPEISYHKSDEYKYEIGENEIGIELDYTDVKLSGSNLLLIDKEFASLMADIMLGSDGSNPPEKLQDLHFSAIGEAFNQMMGNFTTSLTTELGIDGIDVGLISVGYFGGSEIKGKVFAESPEIVLLKYKVKINNQTYNLRYIISGSLAQAISQTITGPRQEAPSVQQAVPQAAPPQPVPPVQQQVPLQQPQQQQYIPPQPPLPQQPAAVQQPVQTAQFPQFAPSQPQAPVGSETINLLMDVPMEISVELGRTQKLVKEILNFSKGSVVELDKTSNEPVDILCNGKLIARGEVVVLEGNFAIRIIDIISPEERLNFM